MLQQLINWVASLSNDAVIALGSFLTSLVVVLASLIAFMLWGRHQKGLEIEKLRLELKKLTQDLDTRILVSEKLKLEIEKLILENADLRKKASPIYMPTLEEIVRIGRGHYADDKVTPEEINHFLQKYSATIKKKARKLSDLLVDKTPEEIRLQSEMWIEINEFGKEKAADIFDANELLTQLGKTPEEIRLQSEMWIEINKFGKEIAADIFDAYEHLVKSAKEKGLKLDLKILADFVGYKEIITIDDESKTISMSGEMMLKYIQALDELIRNDQVTDLTLCHFIEQWGVHYLLASESGIPKEILDCLKNELVNSLRSVRGR
jgi:uncharacterized protein YuzE